ncbi:aminopeptidase N [Cephus cinctus]|uniref:Aminopeptidase n=1 Tax=Cephus cinctus TaxID=211228 RepID=A0AAJ7W638_CEPCN|nr:aminopeptidase N [Cephus cinctus]XP_015606054.1 aminopeptidase N [Cephus cinctus]XP_024945950.1 aminopeptidase N [Cephus cinctus]
MHRRILSATIFLLALVIIESNATIPDKTSASDLPHPKVNWNDSVSYRLPSEIIPHHYTLQVDVRMNEEDFFFTGTVHISVNVNVPVKRIVLHADSLVISESATRIVEESSNSSLVIISQTSETVPQFYIINLAENLRLGNYKISLSFSGNILENRIGLCRTSYGTSGPNWMAITQFATTYARRAFPCFDEPGLKATFDISIIHENYRFAWSNTRATQTLQNSGRSITYFARTPRMSTYLVAFAVTGFDGQSARPGYAVSTIVRPEAMASAEYSIVKGEQQYRAIQNWMGQPDFVDKVEQLAVPDFLYSGMENWGLITYRESVLLQMDGVTSSKDLQTITNIMSHEYAHVWFGNMVTPSWWDYVWLSEGFATYFEYFGSSLVHSHWRLMEQYVVNVVHSALSYDSLSSTRAMNGEGIGSPSTIAQSLDIVSYQKAGSVIRMLSHIIGEEVFCTGLRNYLKTMALQAATPSDLYRLLQAEADASGILQTHVTVENVMNTWSNQPGYPLITVTRNYSNTVTEVSQERFYLDADLSTVNPDKFRWWVPVNYATENSLSNFNVTNAIDWIRPQDKSIIISEFNSSGWVIFNVQQVGYYRVNYDTTNWHLLINYLRTNNYDVIPPTNRASLIDDAFNLARAGYIDYSIALNLTKYLHQETDYIPWVAASNSFAFLDGRLLRQPIYPVYQKYINSLVKNLGKSLSFHENLFDLHITKLLRNLILTWSCNTNDEDSLYNAQRLFDIWIKDPASTITPDLKSFVYCSGLRSASRNTWELVWQRYINTDLANEQNLLLSGLGCTADRTSVERYLNISIDPASPVRFHNRNTMFTSVLRSNVDNWSVVNQFVKNNADRIVDTSGISRLLSMLNSLGNTIVSREQLNEFQNTLSGFNEKYFTTDVNVDDIIARAEKTLAWIDMYVPGIEIWLEENIEKSSSTASTVNIFTITTVLLITIVKILIDDLNKF